MSEWQTIESAPKDGRHILVFYRNKLGKARTVGAFYVQPNTLEYEDPPYDDEEYAPEGWYESAWAHESTAMLEETPTHWQPLPPPPTTGAAA